MPATGQSMAAYVEPRDTPYGEFRRQGRNKLAIVGFCQSSRDGAPYDDPEFVIVGLNRGYIFMPRADVWYEMHSQTIFSSDQRRPGKHVQWLNSFPGPVYMHKAFSEVTTSVVYPLKEISEFLFPHISHIGGEVKVLNPGSSSGPTLWKVDAGTPEPLADAPYISSSIAYEIAHAIYEGFEEIHLYGVDLNTESEYAWQKPGVEFLLGLAAGRGIKVVLPSNCPLLKGTLYGRGFMSERPEAMSYDQLKTRVDNLRHEIERVEQEKLMMEGAARECAFQNAQMTPGLDHERNDKRAQQMNQRIHQLTQGILERRGALTESMYWLHQTMEGMQPDEAIRQLNELQAAISKELDHGPDGPIVDYDALTDRDSRVVDYMLDERELVAGGVP